MAFPVPDLEGRLAEAGERLLSPPSDVGELLNVLDQTESLLAKVEQCPSQSMSVALHPVMKALITKELLRHSDKDVKVFVASCISEITRITAPETPYDDELMKEIFALIVKAFEDLDEFSGRSYSKRLSILETVANVRSCLVMLDLELDGLILEMFGHFLSKIRIDHSKNVHASIETIMTLVLEESEDISSDLVCCILDSVKIQNKEIMPVRCTLGEKVMGNCAAKLKPTLMRVLQSKGASLMEYSRIVTLICQEASGKIENSDRNASEEGLADDSKLSERTVSEELLQGNAKMGAKVCCPGTGTAAGKSPKSVTSNGTIRTAVNDTHCYSTSENITASTKTEMDKLVSISVEQNLSSEPSTKRSRGRKLNMEKTTVLEDYEIELQHPKSSNTRVSVSSPISGKATDAIRPRRGRPPGSRNRVKMPGQSENKFESKPLQEAKSVQKDSDDKLLEKQQTYDGDQQKEEITSERDASQTKRDEARFNVQLVGASIKVWWPDDHRFYRGVVDSFDPVTKKHKVLYADGDVEILLLKEERWEFVANMNHAGSDEDIPCSTPYDKWQKISGFSSKQGKTKVQARRGSLATLKGAGNAQGTKHGSDNAKSTSGQNGETDPKTVARKSKEKSGNVSKDISYSIKLRSTEIVGKPKNQMIEEHMPGMSSRSKEEIPKINRKSLDEVSKTEFTTKSYSPKSSTNPMDDTVEPSGKHGDGDAPNIAQDCLGPSALCSWRTKDGSKPENGSKSEVNSDSAKGTCPKVEVQESDDSALGLNSSTVNVNAHESTRKRKRTIKS